MNFFKKSILAKILSVFFIILFISLVGITTYDSIATKNRSLKTAIETERLLSNQIEQSADVLFATTEMILHGISREKSVTNILVSDKYKNEIYKDFKRYTGKNSFIKGLMMVTNDNQFFQSSELNYDPSDYNAQESSWFNKAVINRGRVIYTSPYINEKTGDREMILAKTVNKDGNVIGVVAAVISSGFIQDLLNEVEIGKTGYAFSINLSGVVTAHHNEENIGLDFSKKAFFKEMLNKGSGYIEYEIDGNKKFLYFKNNPRTNWKFAVVMDHKEIIDEIKIDIIKKLIILVITLIIGTYFSKKIVESVVNPIKRLENAMIEVEQNGNLEIKLDVAHEDEVGILTKNFNNMIFQIAQIVSSVSAVSKTLVDYSSEFTGICENNAATAQQVTASLEEISDSSINQHNESDAIHKETMKFADYINGIIANSTKVSKGVKESQKLNINGVSKVRELHEISRKNIEYVDEVTKEIKGLQDKSQAVAKITENIEKIANQTNMISLNARIEAAKAGEFGESFSVVANEVQRLADETRSLAISIHEYIDEMVDQVKITDDIMRNTKDTSYKQFEAMLKTEEIFNSIEKSSNMIVKEIEDLNASIDKMSIQKESILEGIGNITSLTEQSSGLVKEVYSGVEIQTQNIEQVSQNSRELKNMAKGLEEKISVFSTAGNNDLALNDTDNIKKKRSYLNILKDKFKLSKLINIKKNRSNYKKMSFNKLNFYKLKFKNIARTIKFRELFARRK